MSWSLTDISDAVSTGLRARAQSDDLAQVVYGFDTEDELGLHPLIQDSLRSVGYGVWPEQRYPGHWNRSRRSEGLRCDLVLTHRGLPLRDPEIKNTIFDCLEAEDPQSAFWLEIKTVAQFETDGPFRRYSSELFSPVTRDVRKIWNDGLIRCGGLLLVLFTQGQVVADHDLTAWQRRCLDRGYPIGPPVVRGFPILDRIGNNWCAVAAFSVRGG